ncbi:MAG: helix-turn-helix transcriptional regulator [Bacteroidetes bacterium]|nr:helix-turn-helix transcriptional regulator [Bacteroidota bacterium]
MNRKEILNSEAYWTEQIQNTLFHHVHHYLKSKNKTQNDLAEQLGVSKSYISQILNGNFDHKLSKLVELSLAVGLVPQLQFKTIEQIHQEDAEFTADYSPEFQLQPHNNKEFSELSNTIENNRQISETHEQTSSSDHEYSQIA